MQPFSCRLLKIFLSAGSISASVSVPSGERNIRLYATLFFPAVICAPILFIDDLSFTANDDNFAALKAILEGSVGGRAKNIAVYATSNRRHLIKETLTDRTGDDIHEADTRQELMSLSARFGLTVTFQRPEKARFETILAELAKQHGIDMPMDQLLVKAEAFAIRAGGRSPRVAKQFIEQCEAGVQK